LAEGDGKFSFGNEGSAEEDDDGLGYYPDGIKRNLTDEQISIFRHSEIQSLLRGHRHTKESKDDSVVEEPMLPFVHGCYKNSFLDPIPQLQRPIIGPVIAPSNLKQAKLGNRVTKMSTFFSESEIESRQSRAKRKKHTQNLHRGEPSPKRFPKPHTVSDLRKRTWDIVDKGVEELNYDDMAKGTAAGPSLTKRRHISYED
jgi:hypothetical protein